MNLLSQIKEDLSQHGSKAGKATVQRFIPDVDISRVYGVRMPVINDLAKRYKDGGFKLVKQLWNAESFEEHMLACRILIYIAKSEPEESLILVKRFAKGISDWAICDCLGAQSLKRIHKPHQEQIFQLSSTLVNSKRMWERRLALVLLVNYSKDAAMRSRIKRVMGHIDANDHYYVKKAIAWLNRNFEKHG
ncbi:MAG: DNA alkylation repair protein [Cyclobacteriaceae bacterium]